jgi:RNA polymerase-interacting CarD/CdnL/TRCF family regulator
MELPKSTNNRINNNNAYKDILYLNEPQKTVKLLIHLQKIKKDTKLSYADQSVFDQGLNHLAEEISVVTNTSLSTATTKILTAIKR